MSLQSLMSDAGGFNRSRLHRTLEALCLYIAIGMLLYSAFMPLVTSNTQSAQSLISCILFLSLPCSLLYLSIFVGHPFRRCKGQTHQGTKPVLFSGLLTALQAVDLTGVHLIAVLALLTSVGFLAITQSSEAKDIFKFLLGVNFGLRVKQPEKRA